ncbi:MAG: ribonuclease [Caulobacteraceae bacterium]|nr:ribonuclease [Caulobacteraceae bacterium]
MMKPAKSRLTLGIDGLGWLAVAALLVVWPRDGGKPMAPLSDPRLMGPADFDRVEPGRGRAAHRVYHIPLNGWRDILWRTWIEIGVDRLPPVAAGLAFYLVLAIFPALAAFVSLYGLFASVADAQDQVRQLGAVFPKEIVALLGDAMVRLANTHQAKLSVAFIFSLGLSIWSAKAGMTALFDALNIAYDEPERRPYFKRSALAYGFTAGFILYAALVALILVGLPWLLRLSGLAWLNLLWTPLRWLAVYGLTTLAFAAAYRYGPSRAPARWRWIKIGAALAAALWLVGSVAFSFYLNKVAHFDATYGPLGGAVAFLIWLWLSALIFLLGAELNGEIEHQTAVDSTTGAPLPIGGRGAAVADSVGLAVTRAAVTGFFRPLWSWWPRGAEAGKRDPVDPLRK